MWRARFRYRRGYNPESLKKSRFLMTVSKIAFFGIIGLFLLGLVLVPIFAITLPSPENIIPTSGFSTKILDRNGKVLYDIYQNKNRTYVKLTDIPVALREATISVEDKNFYTHPGFDILGTLRGLSRFFTTGRAEGGSTLTQQLVKNALLTSQRSVIRKAEELFLSVEIEKKYSKDKILELYLNQVPYGGTAYGVEEASETYFGKNVKDLNLTESAILAGLPQSPSTYSPYSTTPKAYVDRTKQVLRRMREDGYITPDQEKNSDNELANFVFQSKDASFKAPHFVQYVENILTQRYGQQVLESGGLKVTTTLDLDLQDRVQQIVSDEIASVEKQHITNGAAVVLDSQTGEILAMIGSKNFNDPNYDGQVNVTTALRQPGSSFKPFTYVTAFKKGFTASTLLMDVPTAFPGGAGQPDYAPVNYDGKFVGPIQVRFALGNSRNVPAVKMLAMSGIKDVLQTATDLGITTLPPTQETLSRVGLSLTLGGGEVKLIDMTDAYAAFMNGGFRVDPVAILKVEDSSGKVLEDNTPQKGRQVLTSGQAFLIDSILSDNNARKDEFGLNSYLNVPGHQIAVKTGTTNDKRDNWTIGGNPQVTVGVWVGNNDNSAMLNVASGVSGASPIWRQSLLAALVGRPSVSFTQPDDVDTEDVDVVSGYRAHDNFPSRTEFFIKGTEPGDDPVHLNLKVCKSDGGIATPSDISSNNYDTKEYFSFKEEDPTANGGPNKWQEAILNWVNTQTDPKYHPPSNYCGSGNPVNVGFDSPGDQSSNVSPNFTIKFHAASTSSISLVSLYIDDNNVRNFDAPPYSYDVTNLSNGVHRLKISAKDANGNQSDKTITIGVNGPWNPSPTPSATPLH